MSGSTKYAIHISLVTELQFISVRLFCDITDVLRLFQVDTVLLMT